MSDSDQQTNGERSDPQVQPEQATDTDPPSWPLSRRHTLLGLLGLGGLSTATQEAAGQPGQSRSGGGRSWQQDIDAGGHTLYNLGAVEMTANPTPITDFEGENLTIDSQGLVSVVDGPGSNLDADTLDGRDLAELEAELEAIKQYAEENATLVNQALTELEGWINSDIQNAQTTLNGGLASIETTLNDVVAALETGFNSLGTGIEDLTNFLSGEVVAGVNATLDDIESAFGSVATSINNVLNPIASTVEQAFSDVDDALTAVENDVNSVLSDVENAIESGVNDIVSVLNTVINTVNSIVSGGPDGPIKNVNQADVNLGSVDIPSVDVNLPQANFSAPSTPQINEPPTVDIPDVSISSVSIPAIDLPMVNIPKPTVSFEDFSSD